MIEPGTKLGPYEIVGPLGAGGMGEVYRATDTRLGRTVAIKVLPDSLSSQPQARERFEREARAVSRLNHPHICALFDVGDEGSTHFLVMEFLEGETLAQRIGRGALPQETALRFAHQIADALTKAHRAGIVHRDLKPANIFVGKQGVKLLDFGLAKERTGVSNTSLTGAGDSGTILSNAGTAAGTVLGTYPYMSPEQLEGKPVDSRCDIFAFGAVLYEMLTGRRAFEGKSPASVIAAILEREPRPITELLPVCPKSLDALVKRCLVKDAEERWQSALDLKMQLEEILAQEGRGLGKETAGGSREHTAWIPWGIAAMVVIGALAVGFLSLRREAARTPIYSSLVPPPGNSFQIEGDVGVPPVLAPDGSAVIFAAGDELWYRSLSNGAERVLNGAKGAIFPFWSPDSRNIGFFADGSLKTLELNGGSVRTLCGASNPRGGSWGTGGVIVFTRTTRDVIYKVLASGGSPVKLTNLNLKVHTSHRWPYFLPDGKHFLYLAVNHVLPESEQNGIYVGSVDGGTSREVVSSLAGAAFASGKILFVKDAKLFAQSLDLKNYTLTGQPSLITEGVVVDLGVWHATFSVSNLDSLIFQSGTAIGKSRLQWVDRSGKHVSFASEAGAFYGPQLSKDGKQILVAIGDPGADIWLFDAEGRKRARLTFDSMSVSEPVWSPDGKHIAYGLAQPNKQFTVNTKGASGAGPARVVDRADDVDSPTDWSPDGKYLLCERFIDGRGVLWLVPMDGSASRGAIDDADAGSVLQSSGQFSPNGKWLAFVMATTGGPQIYIRPFPAGSGMWQVSVEGGRWPRWRRDGQELYYMSDKNVVTAVEIKEKGDGLEVGRASPLFSFRPAQRFFRQGTIQYDVSPDGKNFLLNAAADENTRPLTLVVNWSEGSKGQ